MPETRYIKSFWKQLKIKGPKTDPAVHIFIANHVLLLLSILTRYFRLKNSLR